MSPITSAIMNYFMLCHMTPINSAHVHTRTHTHTHTNTQKYIHHNKCIHTHTHSVQKHTTFCSSYIIIIATTLKNEK